MSYSRTLDMLGIAPKSPQQTDTIKTVALTVAGILLVQKLYSGYKNWHADTWLNMLLNIPYFGTKKEKAINDQIKAAIEPIATAKSSEWLPYDIYHSLPDEGLANELVRQRLAILHSVDSSAFKRSGALPVMPGVAYPSMNIKPGHPAWHDLEIMQSEIISMCSNLLNSPEGGFGMMSPGNKSGIYDACHAYAQHARKEKGIVHPEIIISENADPEFKRVAEQLNVRLVTVPIDAKTGCANAAAIKKAITSNTCMMVASAPSASFGLIDPVEKLAEIANKKNIPLHVDATQGGFFLPFAKEAGYELPLWDFSVNGVMSISMGTNPHGRTPADNSILLFHPDCPATPTDVQKNLNGINITTTWATMVKKGKQGYIEDAAKILELKAALEQRLENIDGVQLTYSPQTFIIGIRTANDINPALVAQKFKDYGWSVNLLRSPNDQIEGFNFCLTQLHASTSNFLDDFEVGLRNAIEYAQQHPDEQPSISSQLKDTYTDRRIKALSNRMHYALPGYSALATLGMYKPATDNNLNRTENIPTTPNLGVVV